MPNERAPSRDLDASDPAQPKDLTVDIVDGTGRLPANDLAWLQDHVLRAGEFLKVTGAVSAKVVGDDEMAKAHEEFCGVPGTTDVITFDLTDPEDGMGAKGIVEADLLLCLDEANRQGLSRGHVARRELLLYAVHGVLHCLGHDDHDEAGYARMHAAEDQVMESLGVGATFATEQRNAPGTGSATGGER